MRIHSPVVWALSLLAGAGVASATGINVALLSAIGSSTFESDVVAKIQANASFLNVTVINVSSTAAPDLSPYQAVMVIGNNPFADPVALGDDLKNFVDTGHGVVVAAYSNLQNSCASKLEICGGFLNSDYWAIEPGPENAVPKSHLGITIHAPSSPLVTNVSTFDGGSAVYYTISSVNAAALDVADWSDGTPLIASRTIGSGTVVGLNLYPPSNSVYSTLWVSTTDGGKILADALAYAAGDPISPAPEGSEMLMTGVGLTALSLLMRRRMRRATLQFKSEIRQRGR